MKKTEITICSFGEHDDIQGERYIISVDGIILEVSQLDSNWEVTNPDTGHTLGSSALIPAIGLAIMAIVNSVGDGR